MKHPLAILSGLFACLTLNGPSLAQDEIDTGVVRTVLSGAQEVPEVAGAGTGAIVLDFDEGLTQATFSLDVTGTNPIVAAHLHCARAGENGPIVVPLFSSGTPEGAPPGGTIAQGTIVNTTVVDPAGDPACGVPLNNVASLFAAVREGLIYANVHTTVNPNGEIRGQLFTNDFLRVGLPTQVSEPQ